MLCFNQEDSTGVRKLDMTVSAREKLHSEFLFEVENLLTQRRLGHMQTNRCPAKMKFLGDGNEVAKMPQFHIAIH